MNPFKADKILHHLEVIQAWKDGKNPYAITTEIDPTNICSHKCPGCAGGQEGSKVSLTLDAMRSCLKQIHELGGKAVTFTGGGEPLLNPATVLAIDYAGYLGLDVGLVTNGSWLSLDNILPILNNCKWVRISLDAGSAKMHRETHGVKDFNSVLTSINCLVAAKYRMKSRCTIGVGYLTGIETNDPRDLGDFVDLAIKLGVDYAQFRPYHIGGAKNDLTDFKTRIDFNTLIKKSTSQTQVVCSEYKYLCILENRLATQYGTCYGHQFATVITASGDMTICCHTRGVPRFTIGSIRKSSIEEIWNSQERAKAIANIDLGRCTPLCRADNFNCILWEMRQKRPHVNFL